MLNKLVEEKNMLLEDFAHKKITFGNHCDAVTQTFERDLQVVPEIFQIEVQPPSANEQS